MREREREREEEEKKGEGRRGGGRGIHGKDGRRTRKRTTAERGGEVTRGTTEGIGNRRGCIISRGKGRKEARKRRADPNGKEGSPPRVSEEDAFPCIMPKVEGEAFSARMDE